jgi:hypothetical protein
MSEACRIDSPARLPLANVDHIHSPNAGALRLDQQQYFQTVTFDLDKLNQFLGILEENKNVDFGKIGKKMYTSIRKYKRRLSEKKKKEEIRRNKKK